MARQGLAFPLPTEPYGRAVSPSPDKMYLSADDEKNVLEFDLTKSTATPALRTAGEAQDGVT